MAEGTLNGMYALTVFTGTWLEAVPFLVLGILFSSVMSVFVPDGFLQRVFPQRLVPGLCFGVLGGFFLPVCDCAAVPVFRTLVKKGIPLPAAVTFMTAAPVVNPVVMLSTWYAFGGNMHIVLSRTISGMICAVLTGLCFAGKHDSYLFETSGPAPVCFRKNRSSMVHQAAEVLSHSRDEFLEAGCWQTAGIAAATVFQLWLKGTGNPFLKTAYAGMGTAAAVFIMMAVAFCLSLCSTSDAVVCAAIGKGFPAVAQLSFLVFGPMMDIKNVVLLSGMCSPAFAFRMAVTTFTVCFLFMLAVGFSSMGIRLI